MLTKNEKSKEDDIMNVNVRELREVMAASHRPILSGLLL